MIHSSTKVTWPHGRDRDPLKVRVRYELRRHTEKWMKYKVGGRWAWTNCSLFKVRSVWDHDDRSWEVEYEHAMALYKGRGEKKRNAWRLKRKRNEKRIDLRVKLVAAGWKEPFWHRLLGWYFHRPPGLSWQTFLAQKDVDHTNRCPARIDWRHLRVVDCQDGL